MFCIKIRGNITSTGPPPEGAHTPTDTNSVDFVGDQNSKNLRSYLVSSHTRTFSQPSGGSLWKQQLLLGPGEDEMSRGSERSASVWQGKGDRTHTSALSVTPENKEGGQVGTKFTRLEAIIAVKILTEIIVLTVGVETQSWNLAPIVNWRFEFYSIWS